MATAKKSLKVSINLEPNTVAGIESVQRQIPAGKMPDMVRYLLLRGLQTVQRELKTMEIGGE